VRSGISVSARGTASSLGGRVGAGSPVGETRWEEDLCGADRLAGDVGIPESVAARNGRGNEREEIQEHRERPTHSAALQGGLGLRATDRYRNPK